MDKRTRNGIFYALCAAFVVLGTLAVLYAQGWRLDFEAFSFKKVGGIYLRSFPDDAQITLNGELIDKNPGLLNRSRFIGGLFPKNYKLNLTSDGYLDWMEHVQVSPSLVTEVRHAVLVPENSTSAYDGLAEKFWVDGNQLLVEHRGAIFRNDEKIAGSKVLWQDDGLKTAVTENAAPKTFFLNDFSGNTPTSTSLNAQFEKADISPSNIKEIIRNGNGGAIFRTNTRIFSINFSGGAVSPLASSSSQISELAVSPSWLAWTNFNKKSGTSTLTFFNRSSRSAQAVIEIPGETVKLVFRNDGELGILQNDGSFYIGEPNGGQPQKTASDVRDFYFSPNDNLVAALESQAVEIFAFNADKDYWRFRLPDAGQIQKLEWYRDENHLFVIYPGEIRFLDLNDEGLENFPIAAAGVQAHYDVQSNTLYFIKNGGLEKLVFPR